MANSAVLIEKQIYDKYNIEAVYLFGSSLKQGFLSEDIDLALLFKYTQKAQDYFNWEAMFHIYLLSKYENKKEFDLSILNLAQPLLKYKVFTEGSLIYCKDMDKLANFEIMARRDYEDYFY